MSKHRISHHQLGRRRKRGLVALVGVWVIVGTSLAHAPRYEHVSELTIGTAILLAGTMPDKHRGVLTRAITGTAAVWLAMAGVVAPMSFTEATSLITGAVFLGACSQLARPAQATNEPQASKSRSQLAE